MKNMIKKIEFELESADIQINGFRPWDMQVNDDRLFRRILRNGSMGLGEAYMDGWQNFGAYYDNTLMAWFRNFDTAWDKLKSSYSEHFYRMWKYYLLSSAASFRTRKNQLWQVVFSKQGIPGGFVAPRYQAKE